MITDKLLDGLYEEQIAAVKTIKNSVIAAGAGSGKTTVLSKRFAYLILERKLKVDQILTLTFTKKATNEMYSRIYKTLVELSKDANGEEKKLLDEAIADFYKARIYTIDSYCSQIVKMAANSYGIRPDFVLDTDESKDTASRLALPFVLKHKNNSAIQALVSTGQINEIAETVFAQTVTNYSSIANPISFDALMKKQTEEIKKAWTKSLTEIKDTICALKINALEYNKSTKFIDYLHETFKNSIPDIPDTIDLPFGKPQLIKSFTLYLLNLSENIKLPGGRQSDEIKELVSYVKDLRQLYRTFTSICNFVLQYELIKTIMPLMAEFQEIYNSQKRASGVLTFTDVAQLALKILKEHPEIRQIEKTSIKAIMIDEFQDDNSLQKDLLYWLAEKNDTCADGTAANLDPEKLFFVGDEKQSIYKFRGADVSVFRRLSDELKDDSSKQVLMTTNHRSAPQLIAAFNTIFGGYSYPNASGENTSPAIFLRPTVSQPELPDFEAEYKPAFTKKEFANWDDWSPLVHVAMFNTKNENIAKIPEYELLNEDEAEAAFIAKKIRSLIDEKKASAQDCAILLRKYKNQYIYEKYLRIEGIPYNSETVSGFFSDGPANDIYSFLKLCVFPSDVLSYSAFLCSPFVNLSHEAMETVVADFSTSKEIFADSCLELLDEKQKEFFLNGKKMYCEVAQKALTQPIADTVFYLWNNLGYRYETLWNKTVYRFKEMYDIIFEMARKADEGGKSLAWFIENQQFDAMDLPLERESAVSILSIHKSKGLEFPIVFLAGCSGRSGANNNASLVYYTEKWGLTLNINKHTIFKDQPKASRNYFFEESKRIVDRMNEAELRRLLYVAMTRAERELYITGSFSGEFKVDDGSVHTTFFKILEPIFSFYQGEENSPFTIEEIPLYERKDFVSISNNTPEKKVEFIENTKTLYDHADEIKKANIAYPYYSPSKLHQSDDETKSTPIDANSFNKLSQAYSQIDEIVIRSIDKETQIPKFGFNDFGTMAHAYLEAAVSKQPLSISTRITRFLSEKDLATIDTICKQMATNFLATEIGKKALNASWCKTEYGFFSKLPPDGILSGSIDLAFETDDKKIFVIDYKTNLTVEPEIYYLQLAAYKNAIAAIRNVPEENVSCFLYYLRYDKCVDVTESCSQVKLEVPKE